MTRIRIFALTIVLAICAMAAMPGPAAAQIVPPTRNAFSFSLATFTGAPLYTLGLSYQLSRPWDLTFAYSFQSIGGATGRLTSIGARYHVATATPGVDLTFGAGLASASSPIPGFGAINASGLYVGGGAAFRMGPTMTGYVNGTLYSLGGAQNAVIDLGVQLQLAPMISGRLGYISLSGSAAPYAGIVLSLP